MNSTKTDQMVKLMLDSKTLNKECKELYKYFYEVFTNFGVYGEYKMHWRISHNLEIVYSNKIEGIDLNIFKIMMIYSYDMCQKHDIDLEDMSNYLEKNCKIERSSIYSYLLNKLAVGFISSVSNEKKTKGKPISFVKTFVKLLETIQENCFSEKLYDYERIVNSIDEWSKQKMDKLLNGDFSNNPLYFFPLYLIKIENIIKNLKFKNILRSVLINFYLMVNKLLYTPTLCFSYPLLYSLPQYIELVDEVNANESKIIDFCLFVFDLLKQSAVISRAMVLDFSKIRDKVEYVAENNPKIFKDVDLNLFLESITLDKFILDSNSRYIDKHTKQQKALIKKGEKIINLLNEGGLLTPICTSDENDNTIFVFKEFANSVKKLNKNKSEKTTKIFILKENLN